MGGISPPRKPVLHPPADGTSNSHCETQVLITAGLMPGRAAHLAEIYLLCLFQKAATFRHALRSEVALLTRASNAPTCTIHRAGMAGIRMALGGLLDSASVSAVGKCGVQAACCVIWSGM